VEIFFDSNLSLEMIAKNDQIINEARGIKRK
jgi:hypothetical protein